MAEELNNRGVSGSGVSPFASQINQLAQADSIVVDTTVAPSITDDTTVAPNSVTDDTTAAPVDEPGEQTVIDYLRTTSGITDEFENSPEGLVKFVDKVRETSASTGLTQKFEQRPILKALDEHIEAGKSIESFFQVQQINANKIDVPKLTGDDKVDAQNKSFYKDVITANMKAVGMTDKQITRVIDSSELENTLYEDAVESATAWNGRQDAQAQQLTQAEELRYKEELAQATKTITDITAIITKGIINGSILPANERQPFQDFILKYDDKGMAERDRKIASLSLEKSLLLDYLLFKDFDVKGLKPITKVQPLDSVNRLAGNNSGAGGDNAADSGNVPITLQNLNFSSLQAQ